MTTMKDIIYNHLRQSRHFRSLSDELLKNLLGMTTFKRFKEGDIVMEQGKKNQEIYCLVNGAVAVEIDNQRLYTLSRKGDVFGEMSIFHTKGNIFSVRAIEHLDVVVLSLKDFKMIQQHTSHHLHHVVTQWVAQILSDKLQLTSQRAKKFEGLNEVLTKANEQLEGDLKVAAEMQQAILSGSSEEVPFIKTVIRFFPWGKVSGDMYYKTVDSEGSFVFFIGDATGHGVPAAFMTMMCTMGLNSINPNTPTDEVMEQLNHLLSSCSPSDKFMTGIFIRITPEGWMTMTNAGHPPIAIVPADGSDILLEEIQSMPLGMFESPLEPYEKQSYNLKKGDKFFVYTDGITEYSTPDGKFFGEERLLESLQQNRTLGLETMLNQLFQSLIEFSEEGHFDDDVTLIGFEMS